MLGPSRDYFVQTDISRFWATGTVVEADTKGGGVVSLVTSASGVGLDDPDSADAGYGAVNTVHYATNPSGQIPVGVLLNDICNEPTNEPRRWNENGKVAYPGRKVCLVRHGWVVTDMITGTPVAGSAAYLGSSGHIAIVQNAGSVQVGKFETKKDAEGFARVFIDL